jgi:nucleoside-diphosphate-sugar epimerase
MITHETPVRPSGIYGSTKVWGEALARHFTDTTAMSIICLRIGAVNREDRPTSPRHFSIWCSQADIAQMVERCLIAPVEVKFDIFFVVSNNKWSYRDLTHAREVVGYEPQAVAEDHRSS